jgi:hypothetical protein
MAAPAVYTVLKAPAGSMPTIDGDLADSPEGYFIDSLHSDDNVYGRDGGEWTREEIQMGLYCVWDDQMVYFGVKVIYDDELISSGANAWSMDNIKVNPGGQAMAFYIALNGEVVTNPSSPYIPNVNLKTGLKPTGNGTFPTYEFAIQKDLLDPFYMNMYQFSIGSEETDAGNQQCFVAIGAEYTGNKTDWNGNPWDNPLYYPTYTLDPTEGPAITGVDGAVRFVAGESISASPNPFMPATTLSFTARQNGTIKIYDINGQVIDRFATKAGSGKVKWNANNYASGLYIARLTSGNKVLNTRLFLTR